MDGKEERSAPGRRLSPVSAFGAYVRLSSRGPENNVSRGQREGESVPVRREGASGRVMSVGLSTRTRMEAGTTKTKTFLEHDTV